MLRMLFPGTTVRDAVKRSSSALMAVAMVLSAAAPFLLSGNASAAQLTERKITMGSSKRGQTDVTYTVSFKATTTSNIGGIVVEFCSDSPLIGATCTPGGGGNTLAGFSLNPGTLALATTGGTWTLDTTNSTSEKAIITNGTAQSVTAGDTITLQLGGAGANDGITNPSPTTPSPATFYARVVTYSTDAGAIAYTSSAPGTHIDDGGIALSTANQLTVNAKVQEQLEFCVGTVDSTVVSDATAPTDCSQAAFSSTSPTVDIGVVTSSGTSISPVNATNGGNDSNGAIMIRTNAFNGASVTYFAEQENSSGRLKVTGSTCSGTSAFDATSSQVDQCFNSNATQSDFSTAGEKFGLTVSNVYTPTTNTTNQGSPSLTRTSDYDGDGTAGIATGGFAWQSDGTTTTLASSTTVLDYEMMLLRFAARAAATTPTGFYAVTSTYVAVPSF